MELPPRVLRTLQTCKTTGKRMIDFMEGLGAGNTDQRGLRRAACVMQGDWVAKEVTLQTTQIPDSIPQSIVDEQHR